MEPVCSMDKSGHRKGSLDRIPNSVFNTPCEVCGKTGGAYYAVVIQNVNQFFIPLALKTRAFTWPLKNYG